MPKADGLEARGHTAPEGPPAAPQATVSLRLETTQHWFEPVAEHLGREYLRYSFTKGTADEVRFLIEVLELEAGDRVLDVGCGPGRHANALAEAGIEVVGIDVARRFVDIATEDAPNGATFVRGDARAMTYEAEFDAVFSMCEGAFGLVGNEAVDGDAEVLARMAAAVKPGGLVGVAAFSAYFQVRNLDGDTNFDAHMGVAHEATTIHSEAGAEAATELWTTCFTPRELRLLARSVGLEPLGVWSVTPGRYQRSEATIVDEELFLLAQRPA